MAQLNDVFCQNSWGCANITLSELDGIHVEIVNLLKASPEKLREKLWGESGLLTVDHHCNCRMESKVIYGTESELVCSGCKILSNLTDLNSKVKSFKIQAGNFRGMEFSIESYAIGKPVCQPGPGPNNRARALVNCRPCDKNVVADKYLECDLFTQNLLVNIYWEHYLRSKAVPFSHVMLGFICNSIGCLILQKKNPVTSMPATWPNLKSLIYQLIFQLKLGENLQLTLGSPDLASLSWDPSMPANVPKDVAPISLTLVLKHASLTVENSGYRFFPRRLQNILGLGKLRTPCGLQATEKTCSENLCGPKKSFYRLTPDNKLAFLYLRDSGIPVFGSSIDFYCIMLALMCYKPFYDILIQAEDFMKLWRAIWNEKDLILILEQIKIEHKKESTSFDNLIEILLNIELQCDPLTSVSSLISGWYQG